MSLFPLLFLLACASPDAAGSAEPARSLGAPAASSASASLAPSPSSAPSPSPVEPARPLDPPAAPSPPAPPPREARGVVPVASLPPTRLAGEAASRAMAVRAALEELDITGFQERLGAVSAFMIEHGVFAGEAQAQAMGARLCPRRGRPEDRARCLLDTVVWAQHTLVDGAHLGAWRQPLPPHRRRLSAKERAARRSREEADRAVGVRQALALLRAPRAPVERHLSGWLDEAGPGRFVGYRRLVEGLARYRDLARTPTPSLPADLPVASERAWRRRAEREAFLRKLTVAHREALRGRLCYEGYCAPARAEPEAPAPPPPASARRRHARVPAVPLDDALAARLRAWQHDRGLRPSALIDEATLAALRVPMAARVEQIRLALQRIRDTRIGGRGTDQNRGGVPHTVRRLTIDNGAAGEPPPRWGSRKTHTFPDWGPSPGPPDQKTRSGQAAAKLSDQSRGRGDFLVANIPAFRLDVYRDGELVRSHLTQVGKGVKKVRRKGRWRRVPGHRTPLMSTKLRYLVLNPEWVVPSSIRREYRFKVARDPEWYSKHGFEVRVAKNGGESLVMKSGPDNLLGVVKFLFPNTHLVYLHDTPAQRHFRSPRRLKSHGCVRVQGAEDLARYLLSEDRGRVVSPRRWAKMLGEAQNRWVSLRHPLDIHLVYWTADVSPEGKVRFYPDVYGFDEADRRIAQREAEGRFDSHPGGARPQMPAGPARAPCPAGAVRGAQACP